MNLIEDLNYAKKIIENENMENYSSIYPFTNENIKDVFHTNEIHNKDCLSVLASSDQVLDMYLCGASTITTFDLNPLTEYYYFLKKAALLAGLSLEEYLDFFVYNPFENNSYFDEKKFNQLMNYLPQKGKDFWKYLINSYTASKLRRSKLFFMGENKTTIPKMTRYLKHGNYEKLQENIARLDISFIHSDIKDLLKHLEKTYDFMYFSNIMSHLNLDDISSNKVDSLEAKKNFYMKFRDYLNQNGVMIMDYFIASDNMKDTLNPHVFKIEDGFPYRICDLPNTYFEGKGVALIYKKR